MVDQDKKSSDINGFGKLVYNNATLYFQILVQLMQQLQLKLLKLNFKEVIAIISISILINCIKEE